MPSVLMGRPVIPTKTQKSSPCSWSYLVARNALKSPLGDENAAEVEKQVEAGKLSLADVDALGSKGQEFSKGVVSIVFGSGNPQEVALAFLASDRHDAEVQKKSAT